ncbi:hypothetical protein Vadar_022599 [Vaccinium darrowii]|uniref:Uncharacterized protein n=1 Tax=Vaccinium darrowii TaxID=229202 RepID=A0ACB7XJA0_9ERIC|nr:hypothetical protein Vadar_022599 [Vaccinium darrowii]
MATFSLTVSLKLLIDTKNKRVLFAEAGRDTVDFLYHLLSLSAGTVIKLLNNRSILDNLGSTAGYSNVVENHSLHYFEPKKHLVSDFVKQSSIGFYIVMDDLTVKPMSTVSGIALLVNEFNGKEVGPIEERVVHLGLDEGLKLLRATLQSDMVLTSVFLGGMGTNDASTSTPNDHVTVGETGPTSASERKDMFEPSPSEAIASFKPKFKGFQRRVKEWFNIISSRQDDIIKGHNRIRRRVDYCVAKLGEQSSAPYVSDGSEGEEEDPSYVPDEEEEEESDQDEDDDEDDDSDEDDSANKNCLD